LGLCMYGRFCRIFHMMEEKEMKLISAAQ
jgi:hypothetical protein